MDLNVKPEMRERFLAAIEENTAASLRDEPGCLRFDMVHDNDDPNHFLLHEHEAAFEAHRAALPTLARGNRFVPARRRPSDQHLLHARVPARERLRARHPTWP
jgi:hypothetical protein